MHGPGLSSVEREAVSNQETRHPLSGKNGTGERFIEIYVACLYGSFDSVFHMKRLSELNLLSGQSETITVSEFRQAPGDVLAQVQMGKSFRITKNGKRVADLTPPDPDATELGAEARRIGVT